MNIRRILYAIILPAVVFCACTIPLIVSNGETLRGLSADMVDIYIPQVNFFIGHPFNAFDYPGRSASLPGYSILLAWAARAFGYSVIGPGAVPIRLIQVGFGLAGAYVLLALLKRLTARGGRAADPWQTAVLWISVVPSYYFIQSSIYLSTDMPSLTIYLAYLYLVIFHYEAIAGIVLAATALVFWRQSYAPVLAAPFLVEPSALFGRLRSWIVLSVAVPGLVLASYVIKFHGLAPPEASGLVLGGLHPSTILHAFAFLGAAAPVYLLLLYENVRGALRNRRAMLMVLGVAVAIAAMWTVAPSNPDHANGRWASIIWSLAPLGPIWGDRSVIVLGFAVIGALFAAALAELAVSDRENRIILLGWALFVAGQVFMPLAFQRYIEPITLASLALVAARSATPPRWRVALFGVVFALYALLGLGHTYGLVGAGS
jgi:hypothetical protein